MLVHKYSKDAHYFTRVFKHFMHGNKLQTLQIIFETNNTNVKVTFIAPKNILFSNPIYNTIFLLFWEYKKLYCDKYENI